MDAATATHAHVLARYTTDGQQREVLALEIESEHALQIESEHALQIIDAACTPQDGDYDPRPIEDRVGCLGEAQAIADDYVIVAEKLGYPPMPDSWW